MLHILAGYYKKQVPSIISWHTYSFWRLDVNVFIFVLWSVLECLERRCINTSYYYCYYLFTQWETGVCNLHICFSSQQRWKKNVAALLSHSYSGCLSASPVSPLWSAWQCSPASADGSWWVGVQHLFFSLPVSMTQRDSGHNWWHTGQLSGRQRRKTLRSGRLTATGFRCSISCSALLIFSCSISLLIVCLAW